MLRFVDESLFVCLCVCVCRVSNAGLSWMMKSPMPESFSELYGVEKDLMGSYESLGSQQTTLTSNEL